MLVADDVRFPTGSFERLAATAVAGRLDVAQPVHAVGSHLSQLHTRRRLLTVVH